MTLRVLHFLILFTPLMLVTTTVFADIFDNIFCEIIPEFCEVVPDSTVTIITTPSTINGVAETYTITKPIGETVNVIVKPKENFIGVVKVDGIVIAEGEVNTMVRYRHSVVGNTTIEIAYIPYGQVGEKGIIVDAQISGLRYTSISKDGKQTKIGITNSKGEFEYFNDGNTSFYVGKIKIAETSPQKMIAITALAITEIESKNIARFLQTIDSDSNPDNGIQISGSVDHNSSRDNFPELNFDDSFFSAIANPTAFAKPCESGPVVVSTPGV